ncbi:MAG: YceD family protein [Sporichthyaceae bacterium]
MPEETHKTQRLDPHAPLVFDVSRLGRRPGSMLRVSVSVPAPADLGLAVIAVPEGAPIELVMRLESVLDGVLASGTARVPLAGECVRCLDLLESDLQVEFAELFVAPGYEGDAETRWLQGDLFDLEPVLRDAVVLVLPLSPVCRDDCPGLCVQCGVGLAEQPNHQHDEVDPRWDALRSLADPGE